jgi:ATP synthase protein I
MKTTIEAPPVSQITKTQVTILLVAVVALAPLDTTISFSVLIGGIIQIVPQAYFSLLAFRYIGAQQAPKIVQAMQKGASGKLLLTAILFGLSFSFLSPLDVRVLFFTYCLMIIIQWFCAAKAVNQNEH